MHDARAEGRDRVARARRSLVVVAAFGLCAALVLVLGLGGAGADTSSALPASPNTAAVERARQLWLALPKTTHRCDEFDYFPEGGMRNFYCHLLSRISWPELQRLAGMPVFLSGPHTRERLNLKSRTSFGHYNPEFVRWLGVTFIPAAGDESFRAATQPIYDRYVKTLARVFYASHQQLRADPAFLEREKRALDTAIARHRVEEMPYEKYYDYTAGGFDGNVSKTAVAFWIRRSIDGTDQALFADLERLLAVYDRGLSRGASTDAR